jgi:hypothetical protein
MEKDSYRMTNEYDDGNGMIINGGSVEVPKESDEERKARREENDRIWNRQWALDKSVEWCKHINELVSSPGNGVEGVIMKSEQVCQIADIFNSWLYKK